MQFTYKPSRVKKRPGSESQTFRVDRLWQHQRGEANEVTHLIDRTYAYHSQRELRWHLADRFTQPVEHLELGRA